MPRARCAPGLGHAGGGAARPDLRLGLIEHPLPARLGGWWGGAPGYACRLLGASRGAAWRVVTGLPAERVSVGRTNVRDRGSIALWNATPARPSPRHPTPRPASNIISRSATRVSHPRGRQPDQPAVRAMSSIRPNSEAGPAPQPQSLSICRWRRRRRRCSTGLDIATPHRGAGEDEIRSDESTRRRKGTR